MKLIEIVLSLLLVSVFLGIFSGVFVPARKVYKDFSQKSAVFERDKFIAESFRRLCLEEKNNVEDFDSWKSMCLSMWKIENFNIKVAGRKDKKTLFICTFDGHSVAAVSKSR